MIAGKTRKGETFLLSDEDVDLLKFSWYIGIPGYVARGHTEYLHRTIVKRMGSLSKCTDHINQDKLDNQRENLRNATHSQNIHNQSLRVDSTSGIRGVSFHKQSGGWRAYFDDKSFPNHRITKLFKKQEDAITYRKYLEETYAHLT